jgi:hypothetical protein
MAQKVVFYMSTLELVNTLISDVPENQLPDVVDFLMFLRVKSDRNIIKDLVSASESSTGFWDNPDDEVWDYV